MRRWIILVIAVTVFFGAVMLTDSSWDGDVTDRTASDMVAGEASAENGFSLFSIEGDLLLFIFLAGGATAGFVAGYNYRSVFPGGTNTTSEAEGSREA